MDANAAGSSGAGTVPSAYEHDAQPQEGFLGHLGIYMPPASTGGFSQMPTHMHRPGQPTGGLWPPPPLLHTSMPISMPAQPPRKPATASPQRLSMHPLPRTLPMPPQQLMMPTQQQQQQQQQQQHHHQNGMMAPPPYSMLPPPPMPFQQQGMPSHPHDAQIQERQHHLLSQHHHDAVMQQQQHVQMPPPPPPHQYMHPSLNPASPRGAAAYPYPPHPHHQALAPGHAQAMHMPLHMQQPSPQQQQQQPQLGSPVPVSVQQHGGFGNRAAANNGNNGSNGGDNGNGTGTNAPVQRGMPGYAFPSPGSKGGSAADTPWSNVHKVGMRLVALAGKCLQQGFGADELDALRSIKSTLSSTHKTLVRLHAEGGPAAQTSGAAGRLPSACASPAPGFPAMMMPLMPMLPGYPPLPLLPPQLMPHLAKQSSSLSSAVASASSASSSAKRKRERSSSKRSSDSNPICYNCGADHTPEWRRGPRGAKTLCNACGIQYSKRVKAESAANTAASSPVAGVVAHTSALPVSEPVNSSALPAASSDSAAGATATQAVPADAEHTAGVQVSADTETSAAQVTADVADAENTVDAAEAAVVQATANSENTPGVEVTDAAGTAADLEASDAADTAADVDMADANAAADVVDANAAADVVDANAAADVTDADVAADVADINASADVTDANVAADVADANVAAEVVDANAAADVADADVAADVADINASADVADANAAVDAVENAGVAHSAAAGHQTAPFDPVAVVVATVKDTSSVATAIDSTGDDEVDIQQADDVADADNKSPAATTAVTDVPFAAKVGLTVVPSKIAPVAEAASLSGDTDDATRVPGSSNVSNDNSPVPSLTSTPALSAVRPAPASEQALESVQD